MLLMIDNYDSFTYNLVQYFGELGAEVRVFRNDEITLDGITALAPRHLVLSPGPCSPAEAGICVDAIRHFKGRLPILGVCLGHQGIGAAFGGKVVRAPEPMHGKTSTVEHNARGVFSGLTAPFEASRYHSLVVSPEGFPADLEVTARTQGDGVIMGLRHRTLPIQGVQFHPESILTSEGRHILRNFLDGRFD